MSKKKTPVGGCGLDPAWQARSDMETLQMAHRIMADPKRVKAACSAAKEQVKRLLPLAARGVKMEKHQPKKRVSSSGNRLFG